MGHEEVADAIAAFPKLWQDAQARERSRDLLVVLPVFERYRDEALEQLGAALRDGPSGVQWAAASALRMLGDDQAVMTLSSALDVVRNIKVRVHIIRELRRLVVNAQSRAALLSAMRDPDKEIRSEAVSALAVVDPQVLLANINVVFDDEDARVHLVGVRFLEERGDAELVADLIERCPNARNRLILLLARLRDPRAVDWLLKIITKAIPSETRSYESAVIHLADLEDPRSISTLISLLGKIKGRENNEKIRLALLSLQAHVEYEERTLIRTAVAGYDDQRTVPWQPLAGSAAEPAPIFTLETYRAFLAEVEEARSDVYWASIARDFEREGAAARKLRFELPARYWTRLPVVLLARCPICGGRVVERVDTFSLSGVGWWYNEPAGFGWFGLKPRSDHDWVKLIAPSYVAECEHAQAVHYGINLNGIIPDDVKAVGDVVIGSERPGVWWPFLEQEDNYAVIHTLPVGRLGDETWQPRYTVHFMTYFSQTTCAFQRSLLPWKWYDPDFVWQYDVTDYDLAPWVEAGKLHWLAEEEAGFSLRQGLAGFPYANMTGLVGRWALDKNKGAKLLPLVKSRALYRRGHPSLTELQTEEQEALQARGFRRISQE